MNDPSKALSVKDNKDYKAFEMDIEGHTAFIVYERSGQVYILAHTEVPTALEGKGIGFLLLRQTLEHIRAQGSKAKVLCPFVDGYVKKHTEEWRDILVP